MVLSACWKLPSEGTVGMSSPILALIVLLCSAFFVACMGNQRFEGMTLEDAFEDENVQQLAKAAAAGDVRKVAELIERGVPVNYAGTSGVTPLWWAIGNDNYEGFSALLEYGANPNIQTDRVWSVMSLSAISKDIRFLQQAIQHGGDVNHRSQTDGTTPLYTALSSRNENNARYLIGLGAKIDVEADSYLGTPLQLTASMAWWEMVYFLLEQGADPFFSFKEGESIIDWIDRRRVADEERKEHWRAKILELLREQGHEI